MKYAIYMIAVAVSMSLIIVGCESQVTDTTMEPEQERSLALKGTANDVSQDIGPEVALQDIMDSMNEMMAAEDLDYRVMMAEYITADGSGEVGNTVFAKDVGNKQLGADFVPNDPRRSWSGPTSDDTDNITYAIDQTGDAVPAFGGVSSADATAAIQRAMGTWDDQTCSDLALTQNPDFGVDIGVVAFLIGLGGSPFTFADVQHAGFRDINFAGGVLGVAFTFVFPGSDIDENGKADVAFREIYYDPSFVWGNDGAVTKADIETIALHEAGHGLSQAHFGKIFLTKNLKFKVAPLAVMNAGYTQVQRELKGTDNGGHCSNWGEWPNN